MENEEIQMNSPNRRDDQKAFILKERICDMHKYGKKIVDRFPGRDKELASEIRQSMLTMYRLVVKIEKKYCKKSTLQELDEELEVLRHLVRIAADKDYYDQEVPKKDKHGNKVYDENGKLVTVQVSPPLSLHKKHVWNSQFLDEIGRLIGGYLNHLNK